MTRVSEKCNWLFVFIFFKLLANCVNDTDTDSLSFNLFNALSIHPFLINLGWLIILCWRKRDWMDVSPPIMISLKSFTFVIFIWQTKKKCATKGILSTMATPCIYFLVAPFLCLGGFIAGLLCMSPNGAFANADTFYPAQSYDGGYVSPPRGTYNYTTRPPGRRYFRVWRKLTRISYWYLRTIDEKLSSTGHNPDCMRVTFVRMKFQCVVGPEIFVRESY